MINNILSLMERFHLHPMLAHFPIALFTSSMGLEILAIVFKKETWEEASWINFILAVLITPLVVLSGWLEAEHLHLSHRIADVHKLFAFLTLGVSSLSGIGLWIIKKRFSKKAFTITFFILLILVVILVYICGYYGGRLVYEYGVGIEE